MNETENEEKTDDGEPGFLKAVASDDHFQRACAGVVVTLLVAGAKALIFGGKK